MSDLLTPEQLADYAAVDFTDLMPADAAAVVALMRDRFVAEVKRLRKESADHKEHLDFLERNTLPELHRNVEHHKAGKQRWRERAEKAEARVAELERPAVEARRNEIRGSYSELISQAEQDRDHEGAATLALQLRDSEAKWQRDDGAVSR